MEATHHSLLKSTPILPHRRINRLFIKRSSVVIANSKQGESHDDHKGKSNIDENMVVLKMRIKKMKVLDSGQPGAAPPSSDWTEWEKKVFTHYHEGVFNSVEFLQSCLLNTRPSIALGMLMLVAMSVPFSSSVAMVNALKVAKGLLAGCHVCIDIDF